MKFFDQIYSRLFDTNKTKVQPILIDNVLKRSDSFIQNYHAWKVSDDADDLIFDIFNAYKRNLEGYEETPTILLHQSANSNGFAVSFDEKYGKCSYQYLLDYLSERVKSLGYRPAMSRHTLKENGNLVETKEMRYLKPKFGHVEPIDQKFGNIQIEYVAFNNQPSRLKFVANTYSDRKYTKAMSFESLIKKVLSEN